MAPVEPTTQTADVADGPATDSNETETVDPTLPASTGESPANPTSASTDATASPGPPPPDRTLSIEETRTWLPSAGSEPFRLTGYVVNVWRCPRCPPGATCKPCPGNYIMVSDTTYPIRKAWAASERARALEADPSGVQVPTWFEHPDDLRVYTSDTAGSTTKDFRLGDHVTLTVVLYDSNLRVWSRSPLLELQRLRP